MLKFTLPEDQAELDLALEAHGWYGVVWDLDNELRSKLKYGHDFKDAEGVLEWARKFIHESLQERGLNLHK